MMTEEDNAHARRLGAHIEKSKDYELPEVLIVDIPRVPYELLQANNKYYMPSKITIGPYHHALQVSSSNSKLESRARFENALKRVKLKIFLLRLRPDVTTEALSEKLVMSERAVRDCYEGISRSEMDNDSFLEMMLLDGCFIIEALRDRDMLLAMSYSERLKGGDFVLDLLKFDNQLPFFFLESLYEMTQHDPGTSFADCALFFFGVTVFGFQSYDFGHIDLSRHFIKHLLDLVMIAFFHSPPNTRQLSDGRLFPSFGRPASKLEDYGVKFRPRQNSRFFTEIVFRNGVLEIPALALNESTASLLSNLLAIEIRHVEHEGLRKRWVASYVRFMGYLVKDVNDLQILCRAGIFDCRVSDPNEMVSLFRDLSSLLYPLIHIDEFCYRGTLIDMHNYCRLLRPRLREYLKRAYKEWDAFNGIILLILTVTQTLFSILGYSPSSGNNKNKE